MKGDDVTKRSVRWWRERDRELRMTALKHAYQALSEADEQRQDMNLHHMRLYGNLPVEGTNPSSYNAVANKHRVTLNLVAAACDALAARIGKMKPTPYAMTVGGNYSLRRKAKLLKRFLEAQFEISRVYEVMRKAFLDAVVFGTSVVKVYAVHDQIKVERIHPGEILVDHQEALYGEPRQLIQRKWISKDVLRETFIDGSLDKRERARLERVIEDAGHELKDDGRADVFYDDTISDQVLVLESWHLPSGPDADDGMHVIAVDSGELFSEPWKKDYFPFLFYSWKDRLMGFWGAGVAEELNGIQVEINRMLMKIQTAYHLMARPLIFVPVSSKVNERFVTNEIGAFVPYSGDKPEVWTPQSFHPEFYAHLERLYQKGIEIVGLSQDTATPQVSSISGVSAKAQHDIGTERFAIAALNFEQRFIDLARMMVDLAKEIAASNGGKFALPAKADRNTIDWIDWDDVSMEDDEYTIRVTPASALSTNPSFRREEVIEMMQAGLIGLQEAKELLNYPDLDAYMALDRAASDDIDRIVEGMLDGDDDTGEPLYEPPDPYMDLNLALKKVQQALNKAKQDGVEEERLELLREWLRQAHELQQRAAMEQQKVAAMAAGQNAPGAPPQLPPGPGAPPATGPTGVPPTAITAQDGVTS